MYIYFHRNKNYMEVPVPKEERNQYVYNKLFISRYCCLLDFNYYRTNVVKLTNVGCFILIKISITQISTASN